MTVSVDDPQAVRQIWADALGVAPAGDVIGIQDATVRFRPVGPEGRRGITHIELTTPRTELRGTTHDVLGVTLDLT
jgi:hypothetical protein